MLKQTNNHADVRTTDRTRTSYTFQVTNCCGCDLCSAAIISRAATGTVGSRKFQLPLWIASCSVHGSPPSRSNVNSYVTTNVYYVTFRYPYIWCSRVFQSRVFSVPRCTPEQPICTLCLKKNKTLNSCPQLSQMLTDFPNSFTGRLTGKFATNSYLNIPPHL